jgi:hypothetical protein
MRIAALCLLLLVIGCDDPKPEQTYQGTPRSKWIELSKDTDGATRAKAYEAMAQLSGEDINQHLLRGVDDSNPTPAIAAMRSCRARQVHTDKVTARIVSLLREKPGDAAVSAGMYALIFTDEKELPKIAPAIRAMKEPPSDWIAMLKVHGM